jgi:phosphatidylserine/phosphatidylglycerophosphate/cardiolipin synthase-like enzyme
MKSSLLTQNIWHEISLCAKKTKDKSLVAVAYFSQGGAKMLPLKKGSKLVVDASESAVSSGMTSPQELLELYNKGVEIYSHRYLHAKIFVIGTKLFIGSANVSYRSSNTLQEAVFTSSDRLLVKDSKQFITSLCTKELGEKELLKLKDKYKAPKITNGQKSKKARSDTSNYPSLHVFNLTRERYTKGYEESLQKGRITAKQKKKGKRHLQDEFEWNKISLKAGDWVLQVTQENNGKFISPIGVVIHIQKWPDNKGGYVFLEIPNKRRKNINQLEKKLNDKDIQLLKRNGKRASAFAKKINLIWE